MVIVGMFLAIVVIVASVAWLGPLGGVLPSLILFGLLFGIYQRTKIMERDLQLIKEKLGIPDASSEPVSDEEIEAELAEWNEDHRNPPTRP